MATNKKKVNEEKVLGDELKKAQEGMSSLFGIIAGIKAGTYTPESALKAADSILKQGLTPEQRKAAERIEKNFKALLEEGKIDIEKLFKGFPKKGHC